MLKNVLEDAWEKSLLHHRKVAPLSLVWFQNRQGVRVEDAVASSRRERRAVEHLTRGDAAGRPLDKAGVAL